MRRITKITAAVAALPIAVGAAFIGATSAGAAPTATSAHVQSVAAKKSSYRLIGSATCNAKRGVASAKFEHYRDNKGRQYFKAFALTQPKGVTPEYATPRLSADYKRKLIYGFGISGKFDYPWTAVSMAQTKTIGTLTAVKSTTTAKLTVYFDYYNSGKYSSISCTTAAV